MTKTREEKNAYLREWRRKNADHVRAKYGPGSGYYRKYRTQQYGMTVEEYDAFLAQGCAICGDEAKHVDHDHSCCPGYKTCGKCVRGALCHLCNLGLGKFKDDPNRLVVAAAYLFKSAR